ncbi:glucokinase, partial [bacterium]|nr:glucokinase [bacterium]
MILAGDLGGTKANLAIYEPGNLVNPIFSGSFPSRNYASFLDILRDFQNRHSHSISKACFGVAGPIINGIGDIS